MRNPERIEPFLDTVKKYWLRYPDLRFAQIVSLFENYGKELLNVDDMFYVEDDVYLNIVELLDKTHTHGNK